MRVIKPLRLSVVQRVLTVRRAHHLSIGLLVYFPFEAPEVALPEVSLWRNVAPILGKDAILDEGLPKSRSEVLVFGKAFSPGGQPRPAFSARLQVATIDKTVFVVGRRRWQNGAPTEPEPITEMPLTWENAFGGPDYPPNPTGMGSAPVEEDGVKIHYLPHVEDPRHLLQSPSARPAPACFGPIDPGRPQRMEKMGTYGSQWVETEFPGFARDLDPEYFQVAPEDQRLAGYLEGGEPVVLENLHPSMPRLTTDVPRLRARCLIEQGGEPLRDISTRLETLLLFPSIERGIALFRGLVAVAEDDATDVTLLLAALEAVGAPKPLDHYRAVLAQRLDKEKGHLYALRDRDLLPEPDRDAPKLADEVIGDVESLLEREGIAETRMRARAQRDLDQARLDLRVLGVDPDEKLPKQVPARQEPPKMDELADYLEQVQADAAKLEADINVKVKRELEEAEAQSKRSEEQARKTFADLGVDYDAQTKKNRGEKAGPPRFSADAELARMRELAEVGRKLGAPMEDLEAKIEDPAYAQRLRELERAELAGYRSTAHMLAPAAMPGDEAQASARADVERALAAGESLARRDLTGIDLRGLSFARCNLREALLERADLSGCDLSGADLAGAVLARAQLGGARLGGANLSSANLGETDAEGASFDGADLRSAVFWKTKCAGVRFVGADLRDTDLFEAIVAGADFSGVEAGKAIFYQLDLTGARFAGAKLHKATFFQCKGADLDFSDAYLEDTAFVGIHAERASFRRARAARLRVVSTSALPGADFSDAQLAMANLRGVDLTGASFERAAADGADFSEALLRGARITAASARGARFMSADLTEADLTGANLMDGLLQKAKLAGARFEKANLFRANLLQAKGDDRTTMAGAHVKRTLYRRQNG